jgi:hypothetical protein
VPTELPLNEAHADGDPDHTQHHNDLAHYANAAGNRDAAGGYAGLSASGKISASAVPAHASTHAAAGSDPVTPTAIGAVPTAALSSSTPAATATSGSAGVSTGVSRADHVHGLHAHASTHNAGGSDALAVDAAAGSGSLRTLGVGTRKAAPGAGAAQAAEMFSTFLDLPDGSAPATADSGQAIAYTQSSGSSAFQIIGGCLTNTASSAAPAAGYAEAQLSGTVTRIGAEVSFDAGSGGLFGVAALLVWQASLASLYPTIPAASCHFSLSSTGWTYGIWPSQGAGGQVVLAQGGFAAPLARDGTTRHLVEIVLDRTKAYIQLPDGSTATITDPRIGSLGGTYASWEVYQSNASTDDKAKFSRVWASADVSPLFTASPFPRVERAAAAGYHTHSRMISTGTYAATTSVQEVSSSLRVPFVVPASGEVMSHLNGWLDMTGSTTVIWIPQITVGGVQIQADYILVVNSQASGWQNIFHRHVGLPVGNACELRWQHLAGADGVASVSADAPSGRSTLAVVNTLGS